MLQLGTIVTLRDKGIEWLYVVKYPIWIQIHLEEFFLAFSLILGRCLHLVICLYYSQIEIVIGLTFHRLDT